MKKLVSLILCLIMALSWLPAGSPFAAAADSPFDGGSGTAEDPYLVSTVEQFQTVKDYSSAHFLQTDDIDLSGGSSISSQSIAEGGVYDGGGNCIKGYNGSTSLFSSNSGTIQNLGVLDSSISVAYNQSYTSNNFMKAIAGGIVEDNSGVIQSCYVKNTTILAHAELHSSSYATVKADAGGIVAINQESGVIRGCYMTGSVTARGEAYASYAKTTNATQHAGGLAAVNYGTIEASYSTAAVEATGDRSTNFNLAQGKVTNYTGTVSASNEDTGVITDCYYTGDQGVGYGQADGMTQKDETEIASPEFAEELNSLCGLWELTADGKGVGFAAENITLSATPEPGTYDMPQTIRVESNRVPAEQLMYSIEGVTSGRQPYPGSITVDGDSTVQVYAALPEHPDIYRVFTLRYVAIRYPVDANPLPDTYDWPQEIELSHREEGAEIYYTTDGSDPISNGIPYTTKIPVLNTTTIKAAAKVNGEWIGPTTFEYVISPVILAEPAPSETLQTGPIEVALGCDVPGFEIYYTTDGVTDPTVDGEKYEGPITIYQTTDLKVVPVMNGQWGEVTTFHYEYPEVTITPSVEPGPYPDVRTLTLTCSEDYLTLSYRLDNGQEQPYTPGQSIEIYQTTELTVLARYQSNLVAQETFTYKLPEPVISAEPAADRPMNKIQKITLSCNVPSYDLYYTLDGSDPASSSGIRYEEPFELDHTATVKVCAKYQEQVTANASFSYTMNLPYITVNHSSGDYTAPLEITLEVTNDGYEILYTLDGSDPKTNGEVYKQAIILTEPVPTTLRAVPRSIFFGDYGTACQYEYTFSSQFFKTVKGLAQKDTDYEFKAYVTNTLPEEKTVNFYMAAYSDGQMLGAVTEQETLPSDTKNKAVTISYPSEELLPEDTEFKLFCLDSVTQEPYSEPICYETSDITMIHKLDAITVEPAVVEGCAGEQGPELTVTAHYTNGKADCVVAPTSVRSGDSSIVGVDYSTYPPYQLKFNGEGSTTVTVSYTEGGITRTATVSATVKPSVFDQGFLANPEADPLPEDAIPISSAQQLAAIESGDSVGKTYYLTRDIQLTGEWEPIYGFQGTLDGRGHKISGLYISSSSKQKLAGLFASAYDAVIKNLAVEIAPGGVSAYDTTVGGDVAYAAGLVGQSRNTDFINCYTIGGPVSATGAAPYAGGLVGYLMNQPDNRVTNCFSLCDVSAKSTQATASNNCMAGGLIGELESGNGYQKTTISRCYATGNISLSYPGGNSGSAGTQAGGLLGGGSRLAVSDCFALGDVTVSKTVGSIGSSLYAGGLGGWLIETTLERCYAYGFVSGGSGSRVGGLVAAAAERIINCYRPARNALGASYYYGGTEIGDPYAQSSYSGFDFTNTWAITDGAFLGKPHLQYQD